MLVNSGDGKPPKKTLSKLSFFVITVLPWAMLLWLMRPSR
jgi:hypothetical protein